MRVISPQKKIWVLLFIFSLIFGFFITHAYASVYSSTLSLLINNNRAERGLNLLILNSNLTHAAQQQADYIASSGEFGHIGYDGSTIQDRTRNAGYGSYPDGMWVAESWATGNIDQAFMTLLNQHSDQNHIFSHIWREVGIGYTQTESGLEIWVVVFGAQPGILPILINYNQEVTYERVVTVRLHNETIIQSESPFGPVVEIRIAEQDFLSEAVWQPWQPEVQLELSSGDGQKWVTAQLRDAQGRLAEAWDTIYLDQAKSFVEPVEKMEIIIDTIPAPTATISTEIDTTTTSSEGTTDSLDHDPILVEHITDSLAIDLTPIEIATNPPSTVTPTTSPVPLTPLLNDLNVAALSLTATPSTLQEVLPPLNPTPSPQQDLPSSNPTSSSQQDLPSSNPTPSPQQELLSSNSTPSPNITLSSEPATFSVESESSHSEPDTQPTVAINQNVVPTLIPTLTPSPPLNLSSVTKFPTAILPKSTAVPSISVTFPPTIEPSTTPLLYALPTVTEYPVLSSSTQWVTPTSLPMSEVTKTTSKQPALFTTTPKAAKTAFNASPTSISSFTPNPTTTATPVRLANLAASSLSSPSSLSSESPTSPSASSSSLFGGITIKRAILVVTLLIIEAILLFAIGRLLFLGGIMRRR